MKRKLFCLFAAIVVLGLSRPAAAGLIDRGLFAYDDGAGQFGTVNLIYDDDFDITWVSDGNFAQTTGFDADGMMTWDTSVAWAGGLTIGGFADWRLPTALNQDGSGPDGPGFNITGSEMDHLFYDELGGTVGNPISVSSDPDLGLFPNLLDDVYWSGTVLSQIGGIDPSWSSTSTTATRTQPIRVLSSLRWQFVPVMFLTTQQPPSRNQRLLRCSGSAWWVWRSMV